MAKKMGLKVDIFLLLQLALVLYLIFSGIQGIGNYKSPVRSDFTFINNLLKNSSNDPVSLGFAIAKIIAGCVLAGSLFLRGIELYLSMAVFIFWIAQMVYSSLLVRMAITKNKISFIPDFPGWLVMLLAELIILICLWLLSRKKG